MLPFVIGKIVTLTVQKIMIAKKKRISLKCHVLSI